MITEREVSNRGPFQKIAKVIESYQRQEFTTKQLKMDTYPQNISVGSLLSELVKRETLKKTGRGKYIQVKEIRIKTRPKGSLADAVWEVLRDTNPQNKLTASEITIIVEEELDDGEDSLYAVSNVLYHFFDTGAVKRFGAGYMGDPYRYEVVPGTEERPKILSMTTPTTQKKQRQLWVRNVADDEIDKHNVIKPTSQVPKIKKGEWQAPEELRELWERWKKFLAAKKEKGLTDDLRGEADDILFVARSLEATEKTRASQMPLIPLSPEWWKHQGFSL